MQTRACPVYLLLLLARIAAEYGDRRMPSARCFEIQEDSCRPRRTRTAESGSWNDGSCPVRPVWCEGNAGERDERLRWTHPGNGRWPDPDLQRQTGWLHCPPARPEY